MSYKIVDNPDGCVHPNKRGERTCSDCYRSQVDEQNRWRGGKSCWEAQCLILKYVFGSMKGE